MSANEQMAASEGLGFVPYTRPTGTDTVEPLKIGVLISGSGTNLQALIDLIAAGKLNASIELVVSSRPSAKGLQRAERAGIQTLTLSKDVYADPIAADEIIAHELLERGCEYVVMAGYMRMVHTPLLAAFPNRVVNLHPALLPSFTGAHAIDDAFARGVKVTGVTVHFANEVYDNGPIIAQRALAVEEAGMSTRSRSTSTRLSTCCIPRSCKCSPTAASTCWRAARSQLMRPASSGAQYNLVEWSGWSLAPRRAWPPFVLGIIGDVPE